MIIEELSKAVNCRKRIAYAAILFVSILALFFLSSCQSSPFQPRRDSQTEESFADATAPTPEKLILPAPTATGPPMSSNEIEVGDGSSKPALSFWISDNSREALEAAQEIAQEFEEESGIAVDLALIPPLVLPDLVQTAVLSDTLPDLLYHPFEFSAGWVEEGILDSAASNSILERLGPDTFDQGALRLVNGDNGINALPSDAWQQIIIYRRDWFNELGLAPPDNFDALLLAAETIYRPENNISGLVVPTDSNLTSTQRVFEHLANANGCHLIDEKGEITLLHPACLETLDFYRILINEYSPIGIQTEDSALNAYLEGRTAIIVASPSVLPALFGLATETQPNCPACDSPRYLAQNSGIVVRLEGNGEFAEPSNMVEINTLGITTSANVDLAEAFVTHWFGPGYQDWLSTGSIQKIPMRLNSPGQDTNNIDLWKLLPAGIENLSLVDFYGSELINLLSDRATESRRWGMITGHGDLTSSIYEDMTFSPLLQDMLSGYFTSSQTIIQMYQETVNLIPNYQFFVE